jgi:hypothetical protein
MSSPEKRPVTAFVGHARLAEGPLGEVVRVALKAMAEGEPVLIHDDATGEVVDIDLRCEGGVGVGVATAPQPDPEPPRGPGRPKLGVVAHEVTLLPRHWDWLKAQHGGASVTLRRLVDVARRAGLGRDRVRASREAAYRFLTAAAGDMEGFEEAMRALFAGDRSRFVKVMAGWPRDVRDYGLRLANDGLTGDDQ